MKCKYKQRKSRVRFFALALIISLSLIVFNENGASEETDYVLEYYWEKAKKEFQKQIDLKTDRKYTVKALTFYHHVDRNGITTNTDTLLANYIISDGIVDSIDVIAGSDKPHVRANFSIPNIFANPYLKFFYPNDTGGIELAIGFDTDSAYAKVPDGILLIDRYRYSFRWLYTYYSDTSGFKHLSRSYRFSEVDGTFFPDSIWEVGVRPGFISSDNYRKETAIQSFKFSD